MAFRRPRVNVKPNVQASRPVGSIVKPQDAQDQSLTSQTQEESSKPSDDPSLSSPVTNEPVPKTEETNEVLQTPSSPLPLSTVPSSTTTISISSPIPVCSSVQPQPPLTPTISSPMPSLFRRKVMPNIGAKSIIHNRRPSASCSGTESESESVRQKHSATSSITFGGITQSLKPINTHESPSIVISESHNMSTDVSIPTKTEASITETNGIHTSFMENNQALLSPRISTKIRNEYIPQHIKYRAQRFASKTEPDMTIRKRRAATLEKLDDAGAGKGLPIDTTKLRIGDFAHYNPDANPMEVKPKAPKTDTTNDPVRKHSISSSDGQYAMTGPQLKIDANGTVVIDDESLTMRHIIDPPRNTVIVEGAFNDDNLTHQSYRKVGRRKRWNNRDTLRFYQALRMCGTDFTLIARVFPNRDRDDIKRKFKTEDRANRSLVDSALKQRIPFDLTCFYSPSEESSEDERGSTGDNGKNQRKRKRPLAKRKKKQTSSSDPLEINRRREKRLQAKKGSLRIKKSAEFVDDEDEESIDVADTVEVTTTTVESKLEQTIPSNPNEDNTTDDSVSNMNELQNILGRINEGHLLFVHNTDETGLDRIDVHVIMPNTIAENNEQSMFD